MSAEEIRRYVQGQYVEPARNRGQETVTIRAGDIHDETGLKHRQPLVCDTLTGRKMQVQCRIELVKEEWGRNVHQRHAKNIWYTYRLI